MFAGGLDAGCDTREALVKIRGDGVYGVVLDAPPRRERQPKSTGAISLKLRSRDGCFNRIPYASLMATLLCFIGVILFSTMMTWGFNATAEQIRRSLRIQHLPWLDKVQVFFVVVAVAMSLFAVFFLLLGFTATGATREEIYKRDQARCGGRSACATAMVWCILLLVCWLYITSICSVFCYSYLVFDDLCQVMPSFSESDCLDFAILTPWIRSFAFSDLRLCGGDAQQFCALSSTARFWYIIGWIGTCLIILGLSFFLAILSANFAHVGNPKRYLDLRDLAVETPKSGSLHLKSENMVHCHCCSGSAKKVMQPSNGWYSPQAASRRLTYSDSTSSSRYEEKMSDSLSRHGKSQVRPSKLKLLREKKEDGPGTANGLTSYSSKRSPVSTCRHTEVATSVRPSGLQ
ncbi:hypothetical protein RB195_018531 [Necator americanus]|uniref:Uncharacterized protein n=1 Tax=Necator americanus TaxID=51031 RepID=A0ABR1CBU5_NECAM